MSSIPKLTRSEALQLQYSLRMHPPESPINREVIFTIRPGFWYQELLDESTALIDLSSLLGLHSRLEVLKGMTDPTYLTETGWPREAIKQADEVLREFSHPLNQIFTVIIGPDGNLLMTLRDYEIQEPLVHWFNTLDDGTREEIIGRDIDEEIVSDLSRHFTIRWHCGMISQDHYILMDRLTGESKDITSFPSPTDLGINPLDAWPEKTLPPLVYRPLSVEKLLSYIDYRQPDRIVIDPTFFIGLNKIEDNRLQLFINDMIAFSGGLFPETKFRGPFWQVMGGLYGWAQSFPSVESLNITTNASFVCSSRTESFRRDLIGRKNLFSVLEFYYHPYKRYYNEKEGGSILYFGGQRDQVYFGPLPDRFPNSWFAGQQQWIEEGSEEKGFAIRLDPERSWTIAAQSPRTSYDIKRVDQFGEIIPLGDLCDIHLGKESEEHATDQAKDAQEDQSKDETYLPRSGDLTLSLNLNYSALHSVGLKHISIITSDESKPLGYGYLGIHIRSSRINLIYLFEYLLSFKNLLTALTTEYSGHIAEDPEISVPLLEKFPVPVVEPNLLEGWDVGEQIERDLQTKADELRLRSSSLFESTNSHEFREKLSELRRIRNLITKSLVSVERLDFQIANFYPFPIAYGYRLLASYVNPFEQYREQLRVAENILAFLGSISLCLVGQANWNLTKFDLKRTWRSGISPGHWREIITHCSKLLKRDERSLASALSDLNIGSHTQDFGADIEFLIKAKNDLKHDRGPMGNDEMISANKKVGEALKSCMEYLSFFTDHPIRLVQELDVTRTGENARLTCLVYEGDHPGLRQEEVELSKPLHCGDLYIDPGSSKEWVALFPFILPQNCPTCKIREVYFIDKWDLDNSSVQLKSFERGHTVERTEPARELNSWCK